MEIKVGDTVKFKDGLYPDEEGARYVVIELNGDRCFIEYIDPRKQFSIPLQSVAKTDELVKV